jgi:HTH-type transcriptional regulator, transcriptional repressor of NAD biosynthesis genes
MNDHALIVGKFAPLHAGHQFLIETALKESRAVTVLVYSNPDFPTMPQQVRAGWVRSLYPTVQTLEPDDPPPDRADDDTHRAYVRDFLASRGVVVDVVYTSEDYGDGFAASLGVRHRLIDRARSAFPVSGSMIRADIPGNAAFLAAPVRDFLLNHPMPPAAPEQGVRGAAKRPDGLSKKRNAGDASAA